MKATYSPEDNKLRLYSETRLDAKTYTRVKAEGFKWAPKQELFVAPMWTPAREDLLIALCGGVGDEDTSLVERAEERADRFADYKEARADDAEQAHKAVSAIADNIPLGQPILVGHHSERHARKDAEKIESGMRRAVKMWETSKYWEDRAKGALHHAKYKELPAVRARRIKGLEAEKRKQERNRAQAELCYRFWKGELILGNKTTGDSKPLLMTEENKETICRVIGNSGAGFSDLPVVKKEGSENLWERWGAWYVLQPDERRYTNCPACTVAQCVEAAHRHYPARIAHCNRWIAHYENRITYERAMMAESGGTATDKTTPQQGGACVCWASHRGGWSYIHKVNRVSVTVLDNWGNGGHDFRRIIPFDKLKALMTAAEVQAAKVSGKLVEYEDKTGFALREQGPKPKAEPPKEDNICPDGQTCPDLICQEERRKIGIDPKPFEQMRDSLRQGVQVVSAPQLFPTPKELARNLVALAGIAEGQRILEPSAGTGSLLLALHEATPLSGWNGLNIVAVEINSSLAKRLEQYTDDVRCTDFLQCNGDLGTFDRIIMNPPFSNGADIKHIQHALTLLNDGGRLVAICANGPRQRETLQPLCDQWIDLEPGAFADSGTNVNAAMLVINK